MRHNNAVENGRSRIPFIMQVMENTEIKIYRKLKRTINDMEKWKETTIILLNLRSKKMHLLKLIILIIILVCKINLITICIYLIMIMKKKSMTEIGWLIYTICSTSY